LRDSRTFHKASILWFGTALLASAPAQAADVPSIRIVSPADGATLVLGDDPARSVNVEIALTNFASKKLGTCGEMPNCGHVHLLIDPPKSFYTDLTIAPVGAPSPGSTCDDKHFPANNQNAVSAATVIPAHFGNCPVPAGRHVIAVALGGDNHTPIAVGGKPVIFVIHVTTVDSKEKSAATPKSTKE
jgi:hypothetical protein